MTTLRLFDNLARLTVLCALATGVSAGCIEVETLKEKREAECRSAISPNQYARAYVASTDCESARMTNATVSNLEFVEVEDSGAESGVRQYFRGDLGTPDGAFWSEGRVEIDCADGSVVGVFVIPATAGNIEEYRCSPSLGGTSQCLEASSLSNPSPSDCSATLQ